ncbi:amino acid ABC transporter substrate-binding protein [Ottowia testudinis]|uniref:Amino acid ABC transporter substrate-binding protein n=1 Tax=Ottowia testudinis TaxID=2816950 RepID=A0A975H4Q5_9BURK|nr:amino acid ABC transporter substrate-binding protein [Ottowia testudinis]QTD44162.1 amino acid ABC transporter substrate-binding protein [Ottowia testudinis]
MARTHSPAVTKVTKTLVEYYFRTLFEPVVHFFMSKFLQKTRSLSCLSMVLAGLFATHAVAGPTLERIKTTGTVNIGYRADSVPFSYTGADGKPMGYALDICAQLVQNLQAQYKLPQLKTQYVLVTGADRIAKITEGKIDLECANTTNSKTRRDQVAFGLTHYFASARILSREAEKIRSFGDLTGKTIALVKGTTGMAIAEARQRAGAKFTVLNVADTKKAVEAVEAGQAHATIGDDVLLEVFKQKSKAKLAMADANLSIEPLAIMMNKGDEEFTSFMSKEMTKLFASGQGAKLYTQWFQAPLPELGFNLNIKLSRLLHDNFIRPNGYVADWTML